jgi:hypothetical protein
MWEIDSSLKEINYSIKMKHSELAEHARIACLKDVPNACSIHRFTVPFLFPK